MDNLIKTKSEYFAKTLRPFVAGNNVQEVDLVIEDIAKGVEGIVLLSLQPLKDWIFQDRFIYDGITYIKGVNDISALIILKSIYL